MRALTCGMYAGSSSPTRNRTRASCIGSTESYPLDHQGSPGNLFFFFLIEVQLIYNVVIVSGVEKSDSIIYILYISIYIFFFIFFFIRGYYKILNVVPCAIQ